MNQENQLAAITLFARRLFQDDSTGHDYYHMKRVARMARAIAIDEASDPFLCEAAGWLHDIGDRKLFSDPGKVILEMNNFLDSISFTDAQKDEINHIISTISFKSGNIPNSLVGKIVQDADRLDAIGAIGIARTFHYGGANNQLIYKPGDANTSIQHFYDKLLKITDKLHTSYARKIAEKRHEWLLIFLEQFKHEWNE